MLKKISSILSSVRFWQAVAGAVVHYFGSVGLLTPEIAESIVGVLGVSVTIGTIDKLRK